jgi:hypothetical protein
VEIVTSSSAFPPQIRRVPIYMPQTPLHRGSGAWSQRVPRGNFWSQRGRGGHHRP